MEVYDSAYEEKLKSMDDILHQISRMDQAENEQDLAKLIPLLLKAIGEYTDADRVYIFDWTSEAHTGFSNTFEWCAKGITAEMKNLQNIPLDIMPKWMELFLQKKTIVIPNVEEIALEAPQEYEMLKKQKIHSEIAVPIYANRKMDGFIGLDNPGFSQDKLSIKLLSDVGGHLGCVRENLRMIRKLEIKQKDLENSIAELQKEQQLLEVLCQDYTAVYECDLKKDWLKTIKINHLTNDAEIIESLGEKLKNCYSARTQFYYDHYVQKEVSSDFIEKVNADSLIRHLSGQERMRFQFQIKPNPAGHEFIEFQAIKIHTKGSGFRVVIGCRCIDETIKNEKEQQKKLQDALAAQVTNNEIISAIGKIYWLIYRLDLESDTYEEISSGDQVHALTGKTGRISVKFVAAREAVVAPEYQDIMGDFLNMSTLPNRLKNTETISQEYKSSTGSWHLGRFIVKKRDENGAVTNVLYVVHEINTQKQLELEYQNKLRVSMEEAKRANAAKTDFLRRMSHDIRTPINAIKGFVDMGDYYAGDEGYQKECRQKIRNASGYLLELVNHVLDMNKLESGQAVLEIKPFNLQELLEKTEEIIEVQANENGISFSTEKTDLLEPYVCGSPLHLKQILVNIMGNAIKYNKIGGTVQISVREIRKDAEHIVLEWICSDTGIGISEKFQKKMFEPFSQENPDAGTAYSGTGLGLSIVKGLIEQMNGTITVESKTGIGTKVTIHVPLVLEHKKEQKTGADRSEIQSFKGKKILLVEDNEMNMEIAEFLLKKEGMDVKKAWNGKEAVEIFQDSIPGEYSMIFMDIMMPVMDGLEATRNIRQMPRPDAKEIPIFAMTANAFQDDAEKSRMAGMNEHFTKPLEINKIMETIQKYSTVN